jgi:hypothetical protein
MFSISIILRGDDVWTADFKYVVVAGGRNVLQICERISFGGIVSGHLK